MQWYSEKEFLLKIPKHSQKKQQQSLLKNNCNLEQGILKEDLRHACFRGEFSEIFQSRYFIAHPQVAVYS